MILPLETTSVAYAPPAVYRTPTGDTISQDLVDSEDDMNLDPDFENDGSNDDLDEELDDDFYDCRDEEMNNISPAWSEDSDTGGGTETAPLDLTSDRSPHRSERAPTAPAKNDKLFSDTSDDEASVPSPIVVDLTHSSDDTMVPERLSSSSDSGSVVNDQDFLNIGFDSICAFAGRSLRFREPRLPTDAEQKSCNHLYIEECIIKYERGKMIEDQQRYEEVSMFDPLFRPTMTSMNPTYASLLQNALDTGLDDDAEGVFTYVSEVDEELDEEDDADDDQGDNASENSSSRTFCVGQLASPDTSLILVLCTLSHLRSPLFWILDTGASTHSTPRKLTAVKERKVVSIDVFANNGNAMKFHSRSDIRGTLYSKEDSPVSKIVLVGVNHTPNSKFKL